MLHINFWLWTVLTNLCTELVSWLNFVELGPHHYDWRVFSHFLHGGTEVSLRPHCSNSSSFLMQLPCPLLLYVDLHHHTQSDFLTIFFIGWYIRSYSSVRFNLKVVLYSVLLVWILLLRQGSWFGINYDDERFYVRSQICEERLLASSCLFGWNNSASTGRIFMIFGIWVFYFKKSVRKFFKLKSDKNNGYCTLNPMYI
jgi:hypothetical protein